MPKTLGTTFTLACGHTVRTSPMNPFAYMDAARTPCMRCLMEKKAEVKQAIEEFATLYDEMEALQRRADEAFARYFSKRQAGEKTSGAAWQRLENEASYKSTDVYSAASKLYALDIDPEKIREGYQP